MSVFISSDYACLYMDVFMGILFERELNLVYIYIKVDAALAGLLPIPDPPATPDVTVSTPEAPMLALAIAAQREPSPLAANPQRERKGKAPKEPQTDPAPPSTFKIAHGKKKVMSFSALFCA